MAAVGALFFGCIELEEEHNAEKAGIFAEKKSGDGPSRSCLSLVSVPSQVWFDFYVITSSFSADISRSTIFPLTFEGYLPWTLCIDLRFM